MQENSWDRMPARPSRTPEWSPVEIEDPDWWVEDYYSYGRGILSQYDANNFDLDHPVLNYMRKQFRRFNIKPPCDDLMEFAWNTIFKVVDLIDPFFMFEGFTDVIETEDCYYYQYSINEMEGIVDPGEISPDQLKTFEYWPDTVNEPGGKAAWNVLNDNPGFEEMFECLHDIWKDEVDSDLNYNPEVTELARRYGSQFMKLLHLGSWAGLMWMLDPTDKSAAHWRKEYHPIFRACYETGSCIIKEMTIFDASEFKKINRASKSCASCGLRAWCVELVAGKKEAHYTCENCHTGGIPFPGLDCGQRKCYKSSCPFHPIQKAENPEAARFQMRMRKAEDVFGPLQKLPNGKLTRPMPGWVKMEEIAMKKHAQSITKMVGAEMFKFLEEMKK
ncbi:MAG: hypothetical protein DRQ88_13030 [Epsilonproteobacteria bacterium]|nr:MAG: hypothetical protein DRQ88_13030 [Campylobacterota bacterium]